MKNKMNRHHNLEVLEEKLGYQFRNQDLLTLALSHTSIRQDGLPSNERLEFLGDSILGFIISTYLFDAFPNADEGQLTIKRSNAVSGKALNTIGRTIELHNFLSVAKGIKTTGQIPDTLVGNAMEALLGAIFLDGGMDHVWAVVTRHFHTFISKNKGTENPKSILQDIAQKNMGTIPDYITTNETGPDHAKVFTVRVELNGKELAEAQGSSRKGAEHEAARRALLKFSREENDPDS